MREKMLIWVFLLISVATGKAQDSCGGVIQEKSGFITSPGFPNQYNNDQVCTWDIIAPWDHNVSILFDEVDIEYCENCGCDYVRISSMVSEVGEKWHGYICRPSDLNRTFISEENRLRIVFRSDGARTNKGFKANFNVFRKYTSQDYLKTTSKDRNVQWLLQKKRSGLELPRAILALFLAEPNLFQPESKNVTDLRDSLTISILAQISRNKTIRTHELALYAQALLVTCQDPRDFYGHDLLSELREWVDASLSFVNPFDILALCNAGAEVTPRDVQRVSEAFFSPQRPFWTDIQAIAAMAMQCLSSKLTVNEMLIEDDMHYELKKRQFRNGTVQNLVTTALVVQALRYNNSFREFFNLSSALDFLLTAQDEDGSWGQSVRNSFYILPAISDKSFLDINDKHCSNTTESAHSPPKRDVLLRWNSTAVSVHLNTWLEGSSPINYFTVQYKGNSQSEWVLVSNRIRPDQGVVTIGDLVPGTWYSILVTAYREAGPTKAEYTFETAYEEEETLAGLQDAGGDKVVVQYSVWIEGDVDLERTWRVRVESNKNISFYDIMEMVTKLDNRHNVTYQVVDGKPYVRALLGKEDDPELGIFWFTYIRYTTTNKSMRLRESSPANIRVFPNQELILWYKLNDWRNALVDCC